MISGIQKIEKIIEEIENNLTEEIDFSRLASKMALSLYEFRRIFSFIVGCPLSEYIRKRRLSLAACELMTNPEISIQSISEKYGYSTESAFSKAFREMHGISPTKCQKGCNVIQLFTRPKLEFSVSGRHQIPFTVIKDEGYFIKGLSMISPLTDSCCCDAVWNEFYDKGYDKSISGDRIYASYREGEDGVLCTIGEYVGSREGCENSDTVPESLFAVFKMNTTDDEAVNKKYSEIIYEILPSSSLKRRTNIPTVEVFPRDMETSGFEWEIRIPIENNR